MRIVAVADTHLFHAALALPPGDVFLHAGDMCRRGSLNELERAARWIRSLDYRVKIVVAGNHDWAFVKEPDAARALLGEDVIYLEDAGTSVEGVSFWGSPWQPEFYSWAFNLPRGRPLAEKWALIPPGVDVLVTHGPPEGFGDRVPPDKQLGCADLRARVREVRPRVHLFGHIHEDGGAWTSEGTTFVNCTTSDCTRGPTVVDVDVQTGEVHVTLPPPSEGRR